MKRILGSLMLVAVLVLTGTHVAMPQCKSMVKKCTPSLAPYVYNGQLNSTVLTEGETAELMLTFFAGQDYRIMACGPRYIGALSLKIFDRNKKLLFDSKQHKDAQYWDFKVEATEEYTIQIAMPVSKEQKAVDMNARGCVAVMVGFKNNQ